MQPVKAYFICLQICSGSPQMFQTCWMLHLPLKVAEVCRKTLLKPKFAHGGLFKGNFHISPRGLNSQELLLLLLKVCILFSYVLSKVRDQPTS